MITTHPVPKMTFRRAAESQSSIQRHRFRNLIPTLLNIVSYWLSDEVMRTLLFVWFVGPLVRGFPGSLVVLLLFDPGNKLFAFWLSSFAGGSFVEIYFVFRSSLIYLHWMLNVIVIATVILCRALWKISIAHFLSVLPASFSNSVDFVGFISVFPLPPSLSLSLSLSCWLKTARNICYALFLSASK